MRITEEPEYASFTQLQQNVEPGSSYEIRRTSSLVRGEVLEIRSVEDNSLMYEEPLGNRDFMPGETPEFNRKKRLYQEQLEAEGAWATNKPLTEPTV